MAQSAPMGPNASVCCASPPTGAANRRNVDGISESYFSSNSIVLTTRIFLIGVLVALKGPDSSLPSLPKI